MSKYMFPFNFAKPSDELKKLIAEYPDYSIVVIAGEEANSGDCTWMYCSDISFGIDEILDCETPWDSEILCTDKDDFDEKLEEWLWDEMSGDGNEIVDEENFEKCLAEEKEKYAPFWKKVIAIWATN